MKNIDDFALNSLHFSDSLKQLIKQSSLHDSWEIFSTLSMNNFLCHNNQFITQFLTALSQSTIQHHLALQEMESRNFDFSKQTLFEFELPLSVFLNLLFEEIELSPDIVRSYLKQIFQLEYMTIHIYRRGSAFKQLISQFERLSALANRLGSLFLPEQLEQFNLFPSKSLALYLASQTQDETYLLQCFSQFTSDEICSLMDLNLSLVLKIISMIDRFSISQNYKRYLEPILEFLGVEAEKLVDLGPDEIQQMVREVCLTNQPNQNLKLEKVDVNFANLGEENPFLFGLEVENESSLILEKILQKAFVGAIQNYTIQIYFLKIVQTCQNSCGAVVDLRFMLDKVVGEQVDDELETTMEYFFEEEKSEEEMVRRGSLE